MATLQASTPTGRRQKGLLKKTGPKLPELIGARGEEIVFTGGSTEAGNFAIKGMAFANESRGNHIITSPTEHHAVIETCKFLERR